MASIWKLFLSDAPDLDEIKSILKDLKYLLEAHFCSEKYQRIEFIFVDTSDQLLFVTTSVAVNIKDYDDGDNSIDLSHFEDLHQILRNMVNIRNIFTKHYASLVLQGLPANAYVKTTSAIQIHFNMFRLKKFGAGI